jgi:hypothetical protein
VVSADGVLLVAGNELVNGTDAMPFSLSPSVDLDEASKVAAEMASDTEEGMNVIPPEVGAEEKWVAEVGVMGDVKEAAVVKAEGKEMLGGNNGDGSGAWGRPASDDVRFLVVGDGKDMADSCVTNALEVEVIGESVSTVLSFLLSVLLALRSFSAHFAALSTSRALATIDCTWRSISCCFRGSSLSFPVVPFFLEPPDEREVRERFFLALGVMDPLVSVNDGCWLATVVKVVTVEVVGATKWCWSDGGTSGCWGGGPMGDNEAAAAAEAKWDDCGALITLAQLELGMADANAAKAELLKAGPVKALRSKPLK